MKTPEKYAQEKASFDYFADRLSSDASTEYILDVLEKMLSTGEVFSWSRKGLDDDRYRELLKLEPERREEYKLLASVLTYVTQDERGARLYGDTFPELLSELLELDADITAVLYEIVYTPHLTQEILDDDDSLRGFLYSLETATPKQSPHLSGETDLDILGRRLLTLQGRRTAVRGELSSCGAISAYQHKEGIS